MSRPDVVIIGGGVIGCAAALALARREVAVTVLEKNDLSEGGSAAREGDPHGVASSAAAGILGAQVEAHADGPMTRLCLASRALYPAWARSIEEASGIEVGYRRCGASRFAFSEEDLGRVIAGAGWQRGAGLSIEILGREAGARAEPAVARQMTGGVRFPDDARVDPPRLLQALRAAAERAGARISGGAGVREVRIVSGRARGVALDDGEELGAAAVVVAAGSWSALVGGAALPEGAVMPARGQMVELRAAAPLLSGVVFGPRCYLSPRDDGRVLVGSTHELVGFRAGVTAGAVRDLLAAAIELVPDLAGAAVGRSWSGLRPYTRDELPVLGATPVQGLFVATGHHRNGVLLAPITGEIVAASVLGDPPPATLQPFSATRLLR